MTRGVVLAGYRAFFALLALAAIVVQLADLAAKGTLNPVNYFSYFTIESNLIGVAAFLIGAARFRSPRSTRLDFFRGASALYLTVTFVVFAVLLSGTDVDTAIPWVDFVLHKVMPIAVIADWLIDPPLVRFTYRQGLLWLGYPIVWLIYVMVRGPIAGWYPYPFLDPANGGYGRVALYVVAILIFAAILSAAVVLVGNRRAPREAGGPL